MSNETWIFRLVSSFPQVHDIVMRCFKQKKTYKAGVVNVADGRRVYWKLKGVSSLSETAGTVNEIIFV